jgi:hypothetical protein
VFLPGRACGQATKPYRLLPDLDLRVFACSGNPGHHLLSSQAELTQALEQLSLHCRPDDFKKLKIGFLASLQSAGIQWQNEALAVVSEWYGTGMAKAHLELTENQPGVLEASIVWKVPPPPVTPDTAVYRGAFAVNKSAISKIHVRGKKDEITELSITR